MATIRIDNKEFTIEGTPTILQAAEKVGIDIPHFCYHPGLSISGNCRMCLVEVGLPKRGPEGLEKDEHGQPVISWMPKPQTSCSTPISEGMVVKTHHTSPVIEEAQKGVLEFILINHPLDCPICDQAGECPLQENTFKYGPEGSRFEFEKTEKPKRIDLGPNVVFDGERCINCTRCVRFCDEVAESSQLTVIERGDKNYIATYPGIELDNPYAMNTIDICPVGALTSKHFRFKARVWEMSDTAGICTGCSMGCSINTWVKNNEILRLTPRENQQVNQWWMCDKGRLGFGWMNENRVSGPYTLKNGEKADIQWNAAVSDMVQKIKSVNPVKIGVVVSPYATFEDSYLATRYFKELGIEKFYRGRYNEGEDDHLLIKADKTPNQAALDFISQKVPLAGLETLAIDLTEGHLVGLIVLEDDPFGKVLDIRLAEKLEWMINFAYNWTQTAIASDLVIPAATVSETIGTFINSTGVIQRTRPAKMLRHQNRSLMRETGKSRWDHHAWKYDRWAKDHHVFDAKPTWEVIVDLSKETGHHYLYKSPEQIFSEITAVFNPLAGLTYERIGLHGVKLSNQPAEETSSS